MTINYLERSTKKSHTNFLLGQLSEGGEAWTKIADNLVQCGLVKASQSSVCNQFNSSMEKNHARVKEENKASKVEVKFVEEY